MNAALGRLETRPWISIGAASLVAAAIAAFSDRVGMAQILGLELLALTLAIAYIAWHTDPAWTLSGALVLTVFSGNWAALGFPSYFAPDRLLLGLVLVSILLRGPGARDRPRIRFRAVHWLMALAALYALISSVLANTLFDGNGLFRLVDRHGIAPFALFLVAPVVFVTRRDRQILLSVLVALGAYLGITTIAEMIGPRAIVFPRYILDQSVGIHFGRGRGPFAQAAMNGIALFGCATACVMTLPRIRTTAGRLVLTTVLATCGLGMFLTLQRSIWIGATAGALLGLLAVRQLRPYALPAIGAAALLVAGALAFVPAVAERATDRKDSVETFRDRKNLNNAAIEMFKERPLLGFGWERFLYDSRDRYRLDPDYALKVKKNLPVHNVFLSNAAELGLLGTSLWLGALALGVGGALLRRGPPELQPWRVGLAALFVVWLVVAVASPLTSVFPNALLWLWAGVVWGPGLREPGDALRRDAAQPLST